MQKILFIPGLGDAKSTERLVNRWKNKNRDIYTFDTKWESEEAYRTKIHRLIKFYESTAQNEKYIVISISAGCSLAVSLLAKFPEIESAHLVSGKIIGSESIGSKYRKRAPALYDSVVNSEQTIYNTKNVEDRVVVYRPFYDNVVDINDMLVDNSKKIRIPAIGHSMGIAIALLFYLPPKI